MDKPVITTRNLCKSYRVFADQKLRLLDAIWPDRGTHCEHVHALKDINFEIKRGEAVGVIGRNGSGKSTLLELLTGTLTPTSGSAHVDARVSALLELGSGFNPEYTGRDNVILNGLLIGLSRQQVLNRFDELEAFAEIGSAIERPVKTYSSGMMMRLAFAVQVLCDPEVLVVDEALSVGDFFFQQKCLSYIRRLIAKDTTLLFVSHDMGTVRDVCSRVIYLREGELVFDGLPSEGIPLYFNELGTEQILPPKKKPSQTSLISKGQRFDDFKKSAIWVKPESDLLESGNLLAVAFFDDDQRPRTSFKIGEEVRITVAYLPHRDYVNEISIGLTNKHGQVTTQTGSYQLDAKSEFMTRSDEVRYFDLWLSLQLEAGNYSVQITLGFETGINVGGRIDQSPQIGPLQIIWDYTRDKAPFIGQCGLPARAAFRNL